MVWPQMWSPDDFLVAGAMHSVPPSWDLVGNHLETPRAEGAREGEAQILGARSSQLTGSQGEEGGGGKKMPSKKKKNAKKCPPARLDDVEQLQMKAVLNKDR